MKAIQTRYLGPTNYKGSRIKAWADGWGSVTISYPHEYNTEQAHWWAAKALIDKVNKRIDSDNQDKTPVDRLNRHLRPPTISGGLPNGDWCFCFKDSVVK
jgi:hypothetical protein